MSPHSRAPSYYITFLQQEQHRDELRKLARAAAHVAETRGASHVVKAACVALLVALAGEPSDAAAVEGKPSAPAMSVERAAVAERLD